MLAAGQRTRCDMEVHVPETGKQPDAQGGEQLPPFRVELDVQEGLFLLGVWHEGGKGDIWGWSLERVFPDDTVGGRSLPGIYALADKVLPHGPPE